MENTKRQCNPIVNLLKFTSNKKILNRVVDIQSSLLPNFIKSVIMLGLKKFRVITNFFFRIKNHKFFLKFIYNHFFFLDQDVPVTALNLMQSCP